MYLLLVIKNARGILSYHRNNRIHRTKSLMQFQSPLPTKTNTESYCSGILHTGWDRWCTSQLGGWHDSDLRFKTPAMLCQERVGSGGSGGGVLCATWVRSVGVFFRLNWRWSSPFSKHLSSGDFFSLLLKGDGLFSF